MLSINPYIHFNGNAEEAFTFYKSAFGGEFTSIMRYKDMNFEGDFIASHELEKLMHIALPIGEFGLLLGSDTPEKLGNHNELETRSKIALQLDNKDEAERIFKELSQNGHIEVPFSESAPKIYFGMFRDKFGIEWMINCQS